MRANEDAATAGQSGAATPGAIAQYLIHVHDLDPMLAVRSGYQMIAVWQGRSEARPPIEQILEKSFPTRDSHQLAQAVQEHFPRALGSGDGND